MNHKRLWRLFKCSMGRGSLALVGVCCLWAGVVLTHGQARSQDGFLEAYQRQEVTRFAPLPTPVQTALPDPAALLILTESPYIAQPSNPVVIGYSVAGRPLEVYRFGGGTRYRRMIVAGIHGGSEWNTIALADELIAYLEQNPHRIPADTSLYLLRALNPDGEARAHSVEGRVNEHGVDLNRNWPVGWLRGWPDYGCWVYRPVSAGWRPASEPETIALMAFLLSEQVEALISYHSAALGIFPGGGSPDPASVSLAEAVAAVVDYPYPPLDTGCLYTGTLADWAAANGIPALDIELWDHVHTDFDRNLAVLDAFLSWGR